MFKILFLFKNNYLFDFNERLILDEFIFNYCSFSRNNCYNDNGGIICISEKKSKLKLNNCVFYNCCSSLSGGAIYFNSYFEGTTVELNKICANNCFANSYQFAYIGVYINGQNFYNLLSINKCNNNNNLDTSFVIFYVYIYL